MHENAFKCIDNFFKVPSIFHFKYQLILSFQGWFLTFQYCSLLFSRLSILNPITQCKVKFFFSTKSRKIVKHFYSYNYFVLLPQRKYNKLGKTIKTFW